MRRRSRSTCTSSALRVGTPVGHARSASISRVTTAPKRSSNTAGERLLDRRQRDPRVAVMEQAVLVEQRPHRVLTGRAARGHAGGRRPPTPARPTSPSPRGSRPATAARRHRRPRRAAAECASPEARPAAAHRPASGRPRRSRSRPYGAFVTPLLPRRDVRALPEPPSAAERSPAAAVTAAARRRPGCWSEPVDRPAHADRGHHRAGARRTRARSRSRRRPPARRRWRPSPRRRTAASSAGSHVEPRRVARPGQQHLAARAAVERQHRAERERCRAARSAARAPRRRRGGRPRARTAARSRRSSSPSRASTGRGRIGQPAARRRAPRREAAAEHEAAVGVAREHAVALERDREPVRGRARRARSRAARSASEHGPRLRDRVEHAAPRDRAPGCRLLH